MIVTVNNLKQTNWIFFLIKYDFASVSCHGNISHFILCTKIRTEIKMNENYIDKQIK